MDMNTKDPEELRKEIDFYRSRLEAAEAKISLLTRGFSIEEKQSGVSVPDVHEPRS